VGGIPQELSNSNLHTSQSVTVKISICKPSIWAYLLYMTLGALVYQMHIDAEATLAEDSLGTLGIKGAQRIL
jgi:hypothetical protein